MQAAARRLKGHASLSIMGDLVVDLSRRKAEIGGIRLLLSDEEYRALELLYLRKGTTLTRQMFCNHLYSGRSDADWRRSTMWSMHCARNSPRPRTATTIYPKRLGQGVCPARTGGRVGAVVRPCFAPHHATTAAMAQG